MNKLSLYLQDNINHYNRCLIHYGEYILNHNDIIFNKKISKEKFDFLLNKFIGTKYDSSEVLIYNYKNVFLDVIKNKAYHKKKNKNFSVELKNIHVEIFNKEEINVINFSCKKDYNIINHNLTRIEVSPEIYLNFVNESNFYTFTIEIIVDHNIDNTILKLNKLLKML